MVHNSPVNEIPQTTLRRLGTGVLLSWYPYQRLVSDNILVHCVPILLYTSHYGYRWMVFGLLRPDEMQLVTCGVNWNRFHSRKKGLLLKGNPWCRWTREPHGGRFCSLWSIHAQVESIMNAWALASKWSRRHKGIAVSMIYNSLVSEPISWMLAYGIIRLNAE